MSHFYSPELNRVHFDLKCDDSQPMIFNNDSIYICPPKSECVQMIHDYLVGLNED